MSKESECLAFAYSMMMVLFVTVLLALGYQDLKQKIEDLQDRVDRLEQISQEKPK